MTLSYKKNNFRKFKQKILKKVKKLNQTFKIIIQCNDAALKWTEMPSNEKEKNPKKNCRNQLKFYFIF